jgi:hypothetical protein
MLGGLLAESGVLPHFPGGIAYIPVLRRHFGMPAVLLTFNKPARQPSNGACTFSRPAGASAWVVRATSAARERFQVGRNDPNAF